MLYPRKDAEHFRPLCMILSYGYPSCKQFFAMQKDREAYFSVALRKTVHLQKAGAARNGLSPGPSYPWNGYLLFMPHRLRIRPQRRSV